MSELTTINDSIISIGNSLVQLVPSTPVDPYNPLGLPPFTVRVKYRSDLTPTVGDSQTLVDAQENIWDITKNSTNWKDLFGFRAIKEILGANTTGVTVMNGTFASTELEKIALFDTSSVTDMSYMFSGNLSLTSVPHFDTSSCTDMSGMFKSCHLITSVPLFDTSSCTNMTKMFQWCDALASVPLFDTSSVTDMSYMFYGCTSIQTVPLFNMESCTNVYEMFFGCSSLTSVPLFNTSSVTNMDSMFYFCESLTSIPLFDTSSVTNIREAFRGCTNVESGALALYQQASTQANPPSNHYATFDRCGENTVTGAAELAQIPSGWK